jgi:hypothetical protein
MDREDWQDETAREGAYARLEDPPHIREARAFVERLESFVADLETCEDLADAQDIRHALSISPLRTQAPPLWHSAFELVCRRESALQRGFKVEEAEVACLCEGKGWDVMNEGQDPDYLLGEIQRCDYCELLADDDEAAERAEAAGYTVEKVYDEPSLALGEGAYRWMVTAVPRDPSDDCACPDCDELACAGHGSDDPSGYTFCHACELAGCTDKESACADL